MAKIKLKKAEIAEEFSKKSFRKNTGTEKTLNENFVELQRVMTNLAINFDSLSKKISRLLELFEASAKSLAEKDFDSGNPNANKEIKERLDVLLDQNKILARGVSMLHDKGPQISSEEYRPVQQIAPPIQKRVEADGYQKSISSKP